MTFLGKEHWSHFIAFFRKETLFWQSVLALSIGVLSGYANVGFRYSLRFFHWLFWENIAVYLGIGAQPPFHRIYLLPLIPISGAVLLVLLSKLFAGEILGYGFPKFLELVNIENGKVRKRWVILKTLAASLSIGSGGSTGYEGPVAQVGGAVGYAAGQVFKMPQSQRKIAVAAGAAGAIAAIFNAPIAGVLFAQEIILLGDFTLNTLTLTVISAGAATVVSRAYFGSAPLFSIPVYESLNMWGLPLYALMGIVTGLLAAFYIFIFYFTKDRFDQLRVPTATKPILGGLFVGLVAMYFPQILGEGHASISSALFGNIDFRLALALVFLKMVSNAVTLGSGEAGGIFGPCLFIGTMIGTVFSGAANRFAPGLADGPQLYALVGMGAFLAAVTHAPLTAIFLIFELTNNHYVVLPTFFCTFVATTVARACIPHSIDEIELKRRGINIRAGFEINAMNALKVSEVMRKQPVVVSTNTSLEKLLDMLQSTDQICFPVVDERKMYRGMISMMSVRPVMFNKDILNLVVAEELLTSKAKPVYADEKMNDAIRKFSESGLDEIAVVERGKHQKVIGLIRHTDIINAYHKEILLARVG